MASPITTFRGTFLSNFWPASVVYGGVTYPSLEHAYVAAKVGHDPCLLTCSPGQAKRYGRSRPMRTDWEALKFTTMEGLLRRKFRHPDLRAMLVATGDAELIEGNTWGDRVWGVCSGTGENRLGKMLMQIRSEVSK